MLYQPKMIGIQRNRIDRIENMCLAKEKTWIRLEGKRCYSQGYDSRSRNRWYTASSEDAEGRASERRVGSIREYLCSFVGERNRQRYRLFILNLNRRNNLFREIDNRLRTKYLREESFDTYLKRFYMHRVIGMITMEWHAHKWHKKLIDREQSMNLAFAFVKKYLYKQPKIRLWQSGELMEFIDISARIRKKRKTYLFFLISFVALWAMVPQQLLEYDPSIILNPEMIGILRKAILHEGCPYKEISDLVVTDITQCTCGENPIYRQLAEEFVNKQELESNMIEKKRIFTLVLAISSAILITMLHTQVIVN